MNDQKYDALKLENQLCFPLYACSREVIKKYKPFLDAIDLTYTQYIAMMALWEKKQLTVKTLGEMLYLDSGTLTPLLKKLENKGLVTRKRSEEDERNLLVTLTHKGEALKEEAIAVPGQMGQCLKLPIEDIMALHRILHQMLKDMA
ncbi:MAG: MarR family transcriptional regulator [Clostridiales bacterium]|nr:MarR family transcriptional regulator [Clostridiales bacterium]